MFRAYASAAVALLLLPLPAVGQDAHRHPPSPYTGMEARPLKALSPDEVEGLRDGAGLGYALSAELNGVPGPKHVLELAAELGLDEAQRSAVEEIRTRMLAAARELGARIIEAEAHLDALFAGGYATADAVRESTASIGAMTGALRAVHLTAHLETVGVLGAQQVAAYRRLRGYEPATTPR